MFVPGPVIMEALGAVSRVTMRCTDTADPGTQRGPIARSGNGEGALRCAGTAEAAAISSLPTERAATASGSSIAVVARQQDPHALAVRHDSRLDRRHRRRPLRGLEERSRRREALDGLEVLDRRQDQLHLAALAALQRLTRRHPGVRDELLVIVHRDLVGRRERDEEARVVASRRTDRRDPVCEVREHRRVKDEVLALEHVEESHLPRVDRAPMLLQAHDQCRVEHVDRRAVLVVHQQQPRLLEELARARDPVGETALVEAEER